MESSFRLFWCSLPICVKVGREPGQGARRIQIWELPSRVLVRGMVVLVLPRQVCEALEGHVRGRLLGIPQELSLYTF